VDDQESVALVMFAGEESSDFLGIDVPPQVLYLGFQVAQNFRVSLVEEFEEDLYFLELRVDLLPEVEFGEKGIPFLQDFGGFLPVVVEARLAQLFFESREALSPGGEVKDAS
jgi:hypothetical protein